VGKGLIMMKWELYIVKAMLASLDHKACWLLRRAVMVLTKHVVEPIKNQIQPLI